KLVGIGAQSGDLTFPNLSKIADAYGYKYFSCHSNKELQDSLKKALSTRDRLIFEVFVGESQNFEPKSSSKQLEDGTIVSPPLEDMYPFLPREELKENMEIDKWFT
ncbi:MAG: thiamine pyrophosphate-binding protein, partial [Eubacteriales bacterium]